MGTPRSGTHVLKTSQSKNLCHCNAIETDWNQVTLLYCKVLHNTRKQSDFQYRVWEGYLNKRKKDACTAEQQDRSPTKTHRVAELEASALVVTVPQGVLVKEVLRHPILWCPHLPEVGHMVTKLFNRLHLLIQVVGLNEVTQLKGEMKSYFSIQGKRQLTSTKVKLCSSRISQLKRKRGKKEVFSLIKNHEEWLNRNTSPPPATGLCPITRRGRSL